MGFDDFLAMEFLIPILWGVMGTTFMIYGIVAGFGMGVGGLFPYATVTPRDQTLFYSFMCRRGVYGDSWLSLSLTLLFIIWPVLFFAALSIFQVPILLVVAAILSRRILLKLKAIQGSVEPGMSTLHQDGAIGKASIKFPNRLRMQLKCILTDPEDGSFVYERTWGKLLALSSIFPAAIFGLILGNVMIGVPFQLDENFRPIYDAGFLDLVTPFSLACALLCILMMAQQGVFGMAIHADKDLKERMLRHIHWTTLILLMTFSLIGLYSAASLTGFKLETPLLDLLSNPGATASKKVVMMKGYWGTNYDLHPWMRIPPAFGYLGLIAAWFYMVKDDLKMAFVSNSIAIAGIIGTAGVSMYPFLLPSRTYLGSGLTLWDAPSPKSILLALFFVAILGAFWFLQAIRRFFERTIFWGGVETEKGGPLEMDESRWSTS